MTCDTCEYYDEWEGVCCNGESRWRADFPDPDRGCDKWIKKRSESGSGSCERGDDP